MARALLAPVGRRVRHVIGSVVDHYRKSRRSLRRWRNRRGNRRACYLCAKTFDHFYPLFADQHSLLLFQDLEVIGSDLTNFYCPHCHSFDRERHLAMYFDRLALWKRLGGSVLHFAPERYISMKIAGLSPRNYVLADLEPHAENVRRMSVTAIDHPDESFDVVLCNHVLEHVPDDSRALAEIFRVLKSGGLTILQTPYSRILANSFEDPNITTEELRSRLYGQSDHVRIYGQDFFRRVRQAGFELDIKTHQATMPDIDHVYYGVNRLEDLILANKPSRGSASDRQ